MRKRSGASRSRLGIERSFQPSRLAHDLLAAVYDSLLFRQAKAEQPKQRRPKCVDGAAGVSPGERP